MASVENSKQGLVDIKNPNTQLAIFYFSSAGSIFIGGGASDARNIVSKEFADLTGGTRISESEALDILEEIFNGDGADGVELVGLDSTSFALAIAGGGSSPNYVLFTDVFEADGADTLGFSDPDVLAV